MPTGKRCYQAFSRFVQAFAEGEIVAPVAHIDADADGRLAVDAEHLGRWIAIAALDLGDVRQLIEPTVDPEVEVRDALGLQQSAGNLDKHVLVRRVDDAGGLDGVLPCDRREYLVEVELQVGEPLRGKAEIDLFVLVAEDFDLADVVRSQELGPRSLGEVAH